MSTQFRDYDPALTVMVPGAPARFIDLQETSQPLWKEGTQEALDESRICGRWPLSGWHLMCRVDANRVIIERFDEVVGEQKAVLILGKDGFK